SVVWRGSGPLSTPVLKLGLKLPGNVAPALKWQPLQPTDRKRSLPTLAVGLVKMTVLRLSSLRRPPASMKAYLSASSASVGGTKSVPATRLRLLVKCCFTAAFESRRSDVLASPLQPVNWGSPLDAARESEGGGARMTK